MKYSEVIDNLVETNEENYQLYKTVEELNELSTVLLQAVNKKFKKTEIQEIIDEIGDVSIRLDILKKIFDEEKIQQRIDQKIEKFSGFIERGEYIGNI